jgi:precorrin-6B methylase 2
MHKSVLKKEIISIFDYLKQRKGAIFVDGTLGAAGHSIEICKEAKRDAIFLGIDKDESALKIAKENAEKFQIQVNDLTGQLEKINTDHKAALDGKDAEITKLNKSVETLTKERENMSNVDETKNNERFSALEKELKEIKKVSEALVMENTKSKLANEVSAYRAEKIKDLDESVHEFVEGETKEDIDKSVEKAKKMWEKLAPKSSNKPMLGDLKFSEAKNFTPGDFSSMSNEEWAEQRKKLGLPDYRK